MQPDGPDCPIFLFFLDLLEDTDLEDDVAVQQAWTELTEIAKEQERYAEMRAAAEKELEACKKRSATLEDVSLPHQLRNLRRVIERSIKSMLG